MIPKVIHYCWFGYNEKPELVKRCIESWKKYCPDYEIKEWNEDNFDVNLCDYTKQAYDKGKWAFVSDVARLWIIYNEGGIYLDTDVELHNELDELLNYSCWFGCDDIRYIATGLGFGAEEKNFLVKSILEDYYNRTFDKTTTCLYLNTNVIEKNLPTFKRDGKFKNIDGVVFLGLNDYGKYARHHYAYSWGSEEERKDSRRKNVRLWKFKCKVRNPELINFLERNGETRLSKIYILFAYDFLDYGPMYFLSKGLKKIIRKA